MATKDAVLAVLRVMLEKEEEAIPLYSRNINSELFLSEFSAAERQEVKAKLQVLIVESQEHRRIFEEMIRDIGEDPRDVY